MRYRVEPDNDPMNPREEWDNFGTMVLFHKRYVLGDKDHGYDASDYESPAELRAAIVKNEDAAVILPVYGYDHGGLTISTGSFSCPWDSGFLGFIFVSKETVRQTFMKKRLSKKLLEQAEKNLQSEVETYDQYLTGDVWGYIVETDQGEEVDSCWGFYGYDACEEEAKRVMKYYEEERAKKPPSMVPAPACCTA